MSKDRNYMVTVDYLFNFLEVDYLGDTHTRTVIRKLKPHLARYGIPLYLDNGPQYIAGKFKRISTKWEFIQGTFPKVCTEQWEAQSNGAESGIKTATSNKKIKKD